MTENDPSHTGDAADAREITETGATEVTATEAVPSETAASEAAASETTASGTAPSGAVPAATTTRRRSGLTRVLVPTVLAVLLLTSAGLATFLYLREFRHDQQTSATAAAQAVDAASAGTVALLSYSPGTLDEDFAAAKTHLTGEFLDYYNQFTTDIVTPAAKQKDVKTSAQVVRSAVSELTPDSAVVLVFINQQTTSKENPNGSFTASSVKVGMVKSGGTWLIRAFDPV